MLLRVYLSDVCYLPGNIGVDTSENSHPRKLGQPISPQLGLLKSPAHALPRFADEMTVNGDHGVVPGLLTLAATFESKMNAKSKETHVSFAGNPVEVVEFLREK